MQEPILANRYKILKKLGEGGFGQTFLAEDLHLPTAPRCVVKRLKPEFADEESYKLARRLFEQEAEILYRMGNHPNIPNLLAHFEENGEFFLALELIEGWTLADEFKNGRRLNERETVDLLRQILETLAFVHSQNVIHRDVKPSNLIRRASDGKVFLIDFGAVKQVSVNPFNQNPTFQSTIAIGSHGYMPSEQTAGKPRFASDLYGAGLVAIEALTGMNPLQLMQNRTTGEFIWQHKANVQQQVGEFISRLVRYDFRQRHLSAKEAFSGLNMIASSLGLWRKNPLLIQPANVVQVPPIAKPPEQEMLPPPIAPQVQSPLPTTVAAVPAFQQTLALVPPNGFETVQRQQSKGVLDWFWNNDVALGSVVVAIVFVFFFVLGYTLVRYAMANEKPAPEALNAVSASHMEQPKISVLQEAENQASEANTKEKKATTKNDWDEIGNQYKRAYNLLASLEQSNPDYASAQEKMTEYHRKSDSAYQKGLEAMYNVPASNSMPANYPAYPTQNNYPSSYPGSNPNSYPTPKPTPVPRVTMPGKQSHRTYLAYNILNYNRVENKVITTDDAIFTSSVEKQSSQNKRDSGAVRITIDGGSYSSARIAFKAPLGQKVTSGNFPNAQEYLWQSPTMYAVSFDKLNCYERANHSFTINSIIYDELYSSIAFIDATFTINCGTNKAMGRIRYDAR